MFLSQTFRAFRYRDYFIFWCGLFLGHTGSLILTTAAGWLILELTDSPFYLGLNGLCLGLMRVIFSPLGGAVVDRMDRRTLFYLTQSLALLTALFLGLMNATGLIHVWHVLAVSGLTGLLLSFEQPIRQSIIPETVPKADLVNALSLYNLIFNGGPLFGPAIAGVLIPFIGTAGCFFFHAVGSSMVLVTIYLIHLSKTPPRTEKKALIKDVTEGLSIAWNTPLFFSLFTALAGIAFFARPFNQFMPIFARDILRVGAPGLGLLLMAPGAGAISGGLVLASITRFPQTHRLMMTLVSGFTISVMLFSYSRSFPLALVFLFFAGGFQTTLLTLIQSSLQLHASQNIRGRIMSLYGLLNRGLGPMGAFPMGALATWVGAPFTVAMGAFLGFCVTAYVALGRPHLRGAGALGEPSRATKEVRG